MFRWTETAIEYLRSKWGREGAKEIASAIGTSKNSIIGKAHRIGLSMQSTGAPRLDLTKYTLDQLEYLQELIDQRLSYHFCAVKFCEQFPDVPMRKSIISSLVNRKYLKGNRTHPLIFKTRPQSEAGFKGPAERGNGGRFKPLPRQAEIIPLTMKRLSIEQLTPTSCRWISGDVRDGPGNWYFCGMETDKTYCVTHANLCYNRGR